MNFELRPRFVAKRFGKIPTVVRIRKLILPFPEP